ncbi:hypothetical protein, partial [Campylobacter canadensis]|uniref:hypothetical protein n=1 Tax=Campylobacter canadensis TaxID=449520 RepID=UPI001CCB7E8F
EVVTIVKEYNLSLVTKAYNVSLVTKAYNVILVTKAYNLILEVSLKLTSFCFIISPPHQKKQLPTTYLQAINYKLQSNLT